MNKSYFVGLALFGLNIFGLSQNYTSEELMTKWEDSSIHQTIQAEDTYSDLKINYDEKKYEKLVSEIEDYLTENPNDRLEIRLVIYKLLAQEIDPNQKKEILLKQFRKALILKDDQLLSELYTIYSENSSNSKEDKHFYLSKAIEIQKNIGSDYFPNLYKRLYNTAYSYYKINQLNQSKDFVQESLEKLKDPKNNIKYYILSKDLLGSIYFKQNNFRKSLKNYQEIHKELEEYKKNTTLYKKEFYQFNPAFYKLWKGIADGGIARVYISQGLMEEALPLLESNIKISTEYSEFGDLAKAQNLAAEAYSKLHQIEKSIDYRKLAMISAKKSNNISEMVIATKGLEEIFKHQRIFDSAYFYNELKNNYISQLDASIYERKFEMVNNRLQFENLQNIIQESEAVIQEQKNTRNAILAITIIFILFGIVLYFRNVFKQKLKIIELQKNQKFAEFKIQKKQEEINDAKEQLELFKLKLIQNNNLIESLKSETENINKIDQKKFNYSVSDLQSATILTKEDWENFKKQFNRIYPNYLFDLREKFPKLTPSELRYLCLVKLKLRQNEIASALGVSDSTVRVTWFRMRKKLEIENFNNPEDLLKDFEKNYNSQ